MTGSQVPQPLVAPVDDLGESVSSASLTSGSTSRSAPAAIPCNDPNATNTRVLAPPHLVKPECRVAPQPRKRVESTAAPLPQAGRGAAPVYAWALSLLSSSTIAFANHPVGTQHTGTEYQNGTGKA